MSESMEMDSLSPIKYLPDLTRQQDTTHQPSHSTSTPIKKPPQTEICENATCREFIQTLQNRIRTLSEERDNAINELEIMQRENICLIAMSQITRINSFLV